MKRTAVIAAFCACGFVGSAQANQGTSHQRYAPPGKPSSCRVNSVGYNATGTLVTWTVTPSGQHRFSGTAEVNVTKANHKAPLGDQTFTFTNARIRVQKGVTPAAGDVVVGHGKITAVPKRCSAGFTPTITIKDAVVKGPRHA